MAVGAEANSKGKNEHIPMDTDSEMMVSNKYDDQIANIKLRYEDQIEDLR